MATVTRSKVSLTPSRRASRQKAVHRHLRLFAAGEKKLQGLEQPDRRDGAQQVAERLDLLRGRGINVKSRADVLRELLTCCASVKAI